MSVPDPAVAEERHIVNLKERGNFLSWCHGVGKSQRRDYEDLNTLSLTQGPPMSYRLASNSGDPPSLAFRVLGL